MKFSQIFSVALTRTMLRVQGSVVQFSTLLEEMGRRHGYADDMNRVSMQLLSLLKTASSNSAGGELSGDNGTKLSISDEEFDELRMKAAANHQTYSEVRFMHPLLHCCCCSYVIAFVWFLPCTVGRSNATDAKAHRWFLRETRHKERTGSPIESHSHARLSARR